VSIRARLATEDPDNTCDAAPKEDEQADTSAEQQLEQNAAAGRVDVGQEEVIHKRFPLFDTPQ
jgi:hypothetical protein